MRDDYKNKMASKIAARYQDLEERIMQDIVRRIVKTGEITSTADWQINRLRILGYSSEDIEREIKKTLNASYPEMFELYDKVIEKEYVRDNDVYEQINAEYIPYDQNEQLNQITEAIIDQSCEDLENRIPGSSGLHNGSHQRYLYEKAVIGNRVQGITEKDCNVYCDCSVFFHSGIDWKYNSVKRSCDYVLYLQ